MNMNTNKNNNNKILKHSNDMEREKKVQSIDHIEKKDASYLATAHIDEKGIIKGYASVFNVKDNHNDIVKTGAFKNSLSQRIKRNDMPKMLWQHEMEKPIGYWTKIIEDDHGLYVEGKLLLDIRQAKEAYTLVKESVVEGLSIGYVIKKQSRNNKTGIREILDLDLIEISLVTMPANPSAKITCVKSKNGNVEKNIKNATTSDNDKIIKASERIKQLLKEKGKKLN